MFCPECEGEFRDELTRCPDCEVELVPQLAEEVHDNRPLVTVLATGHPAVLPVARSLLDGAGIPYTVSGEEALGLFPGVGMGVVAKSRAARVQVAADRADEARELLEQIVEEVPDVPDEGEE